MRGVCIVNRHEWFLVDESEVVGRRLSHAAIRSVGISVPYPQPAAVLVESADDVAPETESARLVYGTEEQRVMGDEQVRASSDGLVNDGGGRVGGEHDAVHVVAQISDNEARLILFFGVAQWVQGLENVDDLLEIRHMSHCSGLLRQGTHSAIADKPCSCSSLLDYRLAFAYKQSTGLFAQRLSPPHPRGARNCQCAASCQSEPMPHDTSSGTARSTACSMALRTSSVTWSPSPGAISTTSSS